MQTQKAPKANLSNLSFLFLSETPDQFDQLKRSTFCLKGRFQPVNNKKLYNVHNYTYKQLTKISKKLNATMFLEQDTMLSLNVTMTMNSYCLLYKVNHIE